MKIKVIKRCSECEEFSVWRSMDSTQCLNLCKMTGRRINEIPPEYPEWCPLENYYSRGVSENRKEQDIRDKFTARASIKRRKQEEEKKWNKTIRDHEEKSKKKLMVMTIEEFLKFVNEVPLP